MLVLALVWTALLIQELVAGLSAWQATLATAIWVAFVLELAARLALAPRRLRFLARNWLSVLALFAPALRIFRILRILRLLRAAPVASTLTVVRGLGSGRRLVREFADVEGPPPGREMNVALLVVSRAADLDPLARLADAVGAAVRNELEDASGLTWRFHRVEPRRAASDELRPVADFLDEAALSLAEGGFDLVLVMTDLGVTLRRGGAVTAAASPTARVAVLSLRGLTAAGRDRPARALDAPDVIEAAAARTLRLIGAAMGVAEPARVGRGGAGQDASLSLTARERARFAARAAGLPERELRGGDAVTTLAFHLLMAFRNPLDVWRPLARNGALFLPLALPGLATAAVAPAFVLVFTAEIWDVGLGLSPVTAASYATISVLVASLYLAWAQDLFLPRKDKRVITEHLAVANVVIYASVLVACIGLFLMVAALMLAIETLIFPVDLMQTWPTLDHAEISLADKARLAAFIATVGVTTGALAGGLESRAVIRRLGLFEPEARRSAA